MHDIAGVLQVKDTPEQLEELHKRLQALNLKGYQGASGYGPGRPLSVWFDDDTPQSEIDKALKVIATYQAELS